MRAGRGGRQSACWVHVPGGPAGQASSSTKKPVQIAPMHSPPPSVLPPKHPKAGGSGGRGGFRKDEGDRSHRVERLHLGDDEGGEHSLEMDDSVTGG